MVRSPEYFGGFFVGGHREAGDTPSVMKHIGGVTKCV